MEGRATHINFLHEGHSIKELIHLFVNSAEFKNQNTLRPDVVGVNSAPRFVEASSPAMYVETRATADQLGQLLSRLEESWRNLGMQRPFHSVLSEEKFLPVNINENAIDEFWARGVLETARIRSIRSRHGITFGKDAACVEYVVGLAESLSAWLAILKIFTLTTSRYHTSKLLRRA
jgi:hypothetical protein